MRRAAILAALLAPAAFAYVPSSAALMRLAAARAALPGKGKEVTLTGTLTVSGAPARPAQLILRFPLSCRLEGEGALSLSVKGTAEKPIGAGEGTTGPALRLLQLACPFISYRGLPTSEADQSLRAAALASGADVSSATGLSRFSDRVVYVLGAGPLERARPQLWLYKDSHAPARLIAQGGADLRLMQYGNPAAAEWFPRVLELWLNGQLAAKFEVLEARGLRGAGDEEEDDSHGE